MSIQFCVGSDNIDGKESNYINDIISKLEEKGNTCENLGIGPSKVQNYGLSSNSSGKTAVFIVGGSDIGTYVDIVTGIKNGYYHYDYCWFAFASWTASTWITCEALKNTPLVRAHDDNFSSSSSIAPYIGKPASEYFKDNSDYINYVCGDSASELGEKIANNGESDDKSDNEGESSYLDMLKELTSVWDGEIFFVIYHEFVIIKRLEEPNPQLFAKEGLNIVSNQLTITDYNPDTINTLVTIYDTNKLITIKDNWLIERFGEKKAELIATKYITKYENSDDSTDNEEDSEENTESNLEEIIESVEITDYDEAMNFAKREWNKIRRNDGHSLELQVIGSNLWKVGEWCKIYVPSFNEVTDMFITNVSHSKSSNSDWLTTIKLLDYAPSISTDDRQETNDEEDSEEDESTENNYTE